MPEREQRYGASWLFSVMTPLSCENVKACNNPLSFPRRLLGLHRREHP